MYHRKFNTYLLRISCALLGLLLLLTACNTATIEPAAAGVTPSAPTQVPEGKDGQATSLFVSGVAQNFTVQVIAAVPVSAGGPYWEAMPQHTLLSLSGYPITNHMMKPQVFIYPVKDLGMNEGASKIAESLQILLQNQQAGKDLPFLPLSNMSQMMHAQVKYLDFKNGKGVRFLTEFANGIVPVNNHDLVYTYQGLTSDGMYYVAAVLPINLDSLPADANDTDKLPSDIPNGYQKYVADTASMLDRQPASAFNPDLSKLDAMIQTIEVK